MKLKILFTLLSLIIFCHIRAQDRTITGKVTDVKGSPLGGVNVTAKDYPSLTTISGVDGEFRMEIFDLPRRLFFRFRT
ncbi:MAG: hypothetical protein HC831_27860 [Chloroflexia bacterium]|nr:hypothetical protein [Chloroflexia bacterium]